MRNKLAALIAATTLIGVCGTSGFSGETSTLPASLSTSPWYMKYQGTMHNIRFPGRQTSSEGQIVCALPPSRKTDEYTNLGKDDEKKRLDWFAAILRGEPEDTKGFIVTYSGRAARRGEAQLRADHAKEYLVEKDTFHNPRLNTADCGYREVGTTELWIAPVGAAPPVCSPTVSPGEIRIKSQNRKPARYRPRARKPS